METLRTSRLRSIAYVTLWAVLFPLGREFVLQAGFRLGAIRARTESCECIGSPRAHHHAVYIHGLDTYGPAWIELENRERLRAIAALEDISFALPRAPFRRWPQTTPADVDTSLAIVRRAARTCFPPNARYGLIGFSNGGSLVNQLIVRGIRSGAEWLASSAGEGNIRSETPADLRSFGAIRIIAGRADSTARTAPNFVRALARRNADVRLLEHPGGHELPFAETRAALHGLVYREKR